MPLLEIYTRSYKMYTLSLYPPLPCHINETAGNTFNSKLNATVKQTLLNDEIVSSLPDSHDFNLRLH